MLTVVIHRPNAAITIRTHEWGVTQIGPMVEEANRTLKVRLFLGPRTSKKELMMEGLLRAACSLELGHQYAAAASQL